MNKTYKEKKLNITTVIMKHEENVKEADANLYTMS